MQYLCTEPNGITMESTGIGIVDVIIIVIYLVFIIWWGLRNGKSSNQL